MLHILQDTTFSHTHTKPCSFWNGNGRELALSTIWELRHCNLGMAQSQDWFNSALGCSKMEGEEWRRLVKNTHTQWWNLNKLTGSMS